MHFTIRGGQHVFFGQSALWSQGIKAGCQITTKEILLKIMKY